MAIGMQDAIGTRRYNNTYLVLSKSITLADKTQCIPSLGYGTRLSENIFGEEAGDYRMQGIFGSAVISFANVASLMLEYHELGFNGGIELRPFTWLFLKGFVNEDGYFGGLMGVWVGI